LLRIGRTGRLGKLGYSTTYITRNQDENILFELKYLLKLSGQKMPMFLNYLTDIEHEIYKQECDFCGKLGHEVIQCQKLQLQRAKISLDKTFKFK
jgi:superfamily II DNA/RNA helicase